MKVYSLDVGRSLSANRVVLATDPDFYNQNQLPQSSSLEYLSIYLPFFPFLSLFFRPFNFLHFIFILFICFLRKKRKTFHTNEVLFLNKKRNINAESDIIFGIFTFPLIFIILSDLSKCTISPYIYIYIYIIQHVKARAIPCPHQPPTRGDNTVSVAQGGTATSGATGQGFKKLYTPDQLRAEIILDVHLHF